MKYPVNNIYACIQGEGVHTGIPMVLLRLHGCPVGCPFCDTKETWKLDPDQSLESWEALGVNARYTYKSASEINWYIAQRFPKFRWVLLTGGEPALYNLRELVMALHDGGYKVALETSGTEVGHLGVGVDWVCISPKFNMPGGRPVLPEAFNEVHEIKQVVGKPADITRLDNWLSTLAVVPEICLQPVSQSKKATALCIQTVQERGWRLSIQIHKYINQP